MATTALSIAANIQNAQASTGPRTSEGKQRSAMNAIRHGLFQESPVLPTEDPSVYEAFRSAYFTDFDPQGAIEDTYVKTLADVQWRLNRCTRIEQSILSSDELDGSQQLDGLCRFSLYEGRLTRKFNQTLRDLRLAQETRKVAQEAQMKEAIEVAAECKAANQPFIPAEFGFVFSNAEIQARLNRSERLQAGQLRQSAARNPRPIAA